MSEYTPTTDDIINALSFAYGYGLGGLAPCPDGEIPEIGVRRWLNSVKAEAWDEGAEAGKHNTVNRLRTIHRTSEADPLKKNPYRKGGAE